MALALARRCAGTRSRPGTDDKSRSGPPLPSALALILCRVRGPPPAMDGRSLLLHV